MWVHIGPYRRWRMVCLAWFAFTASYVKDSKPGPAQVTARGEGAGPSFRMPAPPLLHVQARSAAGPPPPPSSPPPSLTTPSSSPPPAACSGAPGGGLLPCPVCPSVCLIYPFCLDPHEFAPATTRSRQPVEVF